VKETKNARGAGRSRDRDATQRAILEAARVSLAEDGFSGFGINGIARRAGCDKQLLYRYFGGLEGLVDAIGESVAAELASSLERATAGAQFTRYAEMVEAMMLSLLDVFRENAVLRQITAWELSAPSALTDRLAATRGRSLQTWSKKIRGNLTPPNGVDVGATNALLIGAVQHLALASASGSFSGVALKSSEDWRRMQGAIRALVRRAYDSQ
jgi:AcrR family transcriptional regulator